MSTPHDDCRQARTCRRTPLRPRWSRSEAGSVSLELVLLTPVLVGAILVIAGGARLVEARSDVGTAASAAARAASLEVSASTASPAGRRAGADAMAQGGTGCAHLEIDMDTHAFRPGGYVSATVTCVADLRDLGGFGLPGSKTFTATTTVPIESHRVVS